MRYETTTPDYSITMRDSTGRTATIAINGACIDELIATGYSPELAHESVESNAFQNAIHRKEIGADAWIV